MTELIVQDIVAALVLVIFLVVVLIISTISAHRRIDELERSTRNHVTLSKRTLDTCNDMIAEAARKVWRNHSYH